MFVEKQADQKHFTVVEDVDVVLLKGNEVLLSSSSETSTAHLKHNVPQGMAARMDEMEKRLKYFEEKDFPLQQKVLIEQGRNHFWNKYEVEYRNDFPGFIREYQNYDPSKRSVITTFKPNYWAHFFQIVSDQYEPSIGPFREKLEGGLNSTHAYLSAEAHSFDKKRVAEMIRSCSTHNANSYECLFQIVCGQSVEDVLVGN